MVEEAVQGLLVPISTVHDPISGSLRPECGIDHV